MLYVIGSPIGNLGDITFRAVETLKSVDLIAVEDTRRAKILLNHYQIDKPLVTFHEHNEAMRTQQLVAQLQSGQNIALITDAGMPSISDPGFRLVSACHENKIESTILPGASAVLTALIGSGLPSHAFYYGGFIPVKSGQRLKTIAAALHRDVTSIFFESPHRIQKTLHAIISLEPKRKICVARELTKKFEQYKTGNADEVCAWFDEHPPRGEITLVIAPPNRE